MPTRSRLLIALLGVLALALVATGGWFYREQEVHLRDEVSSRLVAVAELKGTAIAHWRRDLRDDAAELAAQPRLRAPLGAFLAAPGGDLGPAAAELAAARRWGGHRAVLVTDGEGRALWSCPAGEVVPRETVAAALAEARRGGAPVLTDLVEGPGGDPRLLAVAPIRDGDRDLGALLIVTDAAPILYRQLLAWTATSSSGESYLVRADGDSATVLSPLRFRPGAPLRLRLPAAAGTPIAACAAMQTNGTAAGRDYRDAPVIAAARPVAGSPWWLVCEIDAREALADWRMRSRLILALVVCAVAALASLGLLVWQGHRRALLASLLAAQRNLHESEALHRSTIAALSEGIVVFDLQARVVSCNPAAERILRLTREEMVAGRPDLASWSRLRADGSLLPASELPLARTLATGESCRGFEMGHVGPDGATAWLLVNSEPIVDPRTGGPVAAVVSFSDITGRKQVEAALARSEDTFRRTVESAPDAIFVQTRGRFALVNAAAARLFGAADAAALIGRPVLDLIHPDDRERVGARMRALNERREPVPLVEERLLRLDGATVPIEASAVPFDFGGEQGALVFARDVSERAQLQDELLQAQKMESVGRLAGGVAHDFNNMLGVILGHADLALGEEGVSPELREHLQTILAAAERSADLTRQLLAFARKQTSQPRLLDLNAAIPEHLNLLRRLIGEEVSLEWRPGGGVGPVLLDPAQLLQILANLALNGRDAIGGPGTIVIETRNVAFDAAASGRHAGVAPGEYVMVAVTDDGCGMDRATRDRLFEPYFTTKALGRGTGLGLATVYGIVRQNGGFIRVYSEPGRGTTFKLYLARAADGAGAAAAPAEPPAAAGRGEVVLLVEDEPALREVVQAMLESLGYAVLTAAAPDEALEVGADAARIDLLLTDVVMPQCDGRALAARLRAARPGLRCLFVSGYTPDAIARRGALDPDAHFLHKPFSRDDLARKVREALAAA